MNKLQQEVFNILVSVDKVCRKHDISYSLAYGTLLGAVRHKGFIPWDDDIDIWMLREDLERFTKIFDKELGENFFLQNQETDAYYMRDHNKVILKNSNVYERTNEFLPIQKGLFLDIFPVDKKIDNNIKFKIQFKKLAFYRKILDYFYYYYPSDKKEVSLTKKIIDSIKKRSYKANFIFGPMHKNMLKTMEKYNDNENLTEVICYTPDTFTLPASRDMYNLEDFKNLVEVVFEGKKFLATKNYDDVLTKLYGDYMVIPDEQDRHHHDLQEEL
ncbi:MAG: LicD family protein [Micrococcaceae bacterium]